MDTRTPETLGQGGVKLAGISLPVSDNTATVTGAQKGMESGSSTTVYMLPQSEHATDMTL